MLIINLDELNIRELFEVCHERARDSVKRPVGLAIPGEINICDAIGIFQFGIAREAIEHQRETLISFNITRTLEVFVQNRADDIAG
jgi:hypothetical protein